MTDASSSTAGSAGAIAAPSPDRSAAEVADAIAAAARSVPGVADLHTGAFGEVATYLPGRRVNGVRMHDDVTEVHLVLTWGVPVLATAEAVRRAVAPLVSTRVDISVQDIVGPDTSAAS